MGWKRKNKEMPIIHDIKNPPFGGFFTMAIQSFGLIIHWIATVVLLPRNDNFFTLLSPLVIPAKAGIGSFIMRCPTVGCWLVSLALYSPTPACAGVTNECKIFFSLSSRAYAWRSSYLALLFTRLPRSFYSLAMTRVLFFLLSFWGLIS